MNFPTFTFHNATFTHPPSPISSLFSCFAINTESTCLTRFSEKKHCYFFFYRTKRGLPNHSPAVRADAYSEKPIDHGSTLLHTSS